MQVLTSEMTKGSTGAGLDMNSGETSKGAVMTSNSLGIFAMGHSPSTNGLRVDSQMKDPKVS